MTQIRAKQKKQTIISKTKPQSKKSSGGCNGKFKKSSNIERFKKNKKTQELIASASATNQIN